jgi:hypothetical protein
MTAEIVYLENNTYNPLTGNFNDNCESSFILELILHKYFSEQIELILHKYFSKQIGSNSKAFDLYSRDAQPESCP